MLLTLAFRRFRDSTTCFCNTRTAAFRPSIPNLSSHPFAGAIGVDTRLDPVPGVHTAHPDTDMKVKEEKTSGASPSDEAMAAVQPHKPNHEVAASADAAAHGQSPVLLALLL